VASFAIPNRPVSMTTTAPCRKAGNDCSSNMGTAILEAEKVKSIKIDWLRTGAMET
jgi:hypothetical protein